MMTMVRENSLISYLEEKESGKLGERTELVFDYISNNPGKTSREIMLGLGFNEPGSVRPRITELLKKGLVFESGTVKCHFTGKSVSTYKINFIKVK